MATFGQRVTKLRRQAADSRLAFSKAVKTAYSAVSDIENDKASIPLNRLDAWIAALKVPAVEVEDFRKAAKRQCIFFNLDPDLQSAFSELLDDFRQRNKDASRLFTAMTLEMGNNLSHELKERVAFFQRNIKLPWEG